ncbi:MAG TPA: L-seryl-tRNA(Sec) selenium transferase [Chloroflexia bacterium]|nr:L-seryl-tRNA(Sec) selenium transferase [Chloroflexia bacterium]
MVSRNDDTQEQAEANRAERLRSIPSADKILAHPALAEARAELPHAVIMAAVRAESDRLRAALTSGNSRTPDLSDLASRAVATAWLMSSPSLRPVINATGVIVHTNLGRAPLSRSAIEAIARVSAYSNLEYDLDAGERGSRYDHAVEVLRRVTGCEDALVVNNNAAALVLVLSALAAGREAIVSRGQLVEIGGGFRIPEIMRQSGARLAEVGTTNRTYIADYANAITADTAILLRVHASNFRVVGFTTSPELGELAALARSHNLVLVDDVGSGALLDTTRYGLAPEPLVQASLEAGADLVLFSGDKLLGGPQCGIIAGKSEQIARLRKHPLARALRVDKLTLAALEATLLHYLKGEAEREIPIWRMIATSQEELKAKATEWTQRLTEQGIECRIIEGESAIGGGSLPGETLPTWLAAITPPNSQASNSEQAAGHLASLLRHAPTPIIARVDRGTLLLDPRTVLPPEETLLGQLISLVKRET